MTSSQNADVDREGFVEVPGARLYYRLRGRGSGPLLLLAPGGGSDAEDSSALADALVDRYTVLVYDRRGLSHSTIDDGTINDGAAMSTAIETHADDVHRLLAAVTDQPAFVFASSIGALICLEFTTKHPEQLRALVAHEAALATLLVEPDRSRVAAMQGRIEEAYKRDGVFAAMQRLVEITGNPADDREQETERSIPNTQRVMQYSANLEFFLTHDIPAAHHHELDFAALKAAAGLIIPAAGRLSRGLIPYTCAHALAVQLDRPLVEFPGGHTGNAQRPRAFAATLEQTLAKYAQ